jgi:hypothetical protein
MSRKYVALLRAVNVETGTVAMRDIQRKIGLQRNCDVDRGKLGAEAQAGFGRNRIQNISPCVMSSGGTRTVGI